TIDAGGTVANLGIINSKFSGNGAGTIAGVNSGFITHSFASSTTDSLGSPTVFGVAAAGGLAGINCGNIFQPYASVTVSGVSQDATTFSVFHDGDGGLVGVNNGKIINAYALGNVAGNGFVGGLVGYNNGLIQNTYATGQLFAEWNFTVNNAGPLVG